MKPDRVAQLSEEEQFVRAKDSIGWILSNSPQTATELSRKLSRKGYSDIVVEAAMEWAGEYGFVDDVAYAELFFREYVLRLGKSVSWTVRKLQTKGVGKDVCEQALERLSDEGVTDPTAEHERAVLAGRTVMRRVGGVDDAVTRKRKFLSRLARMGYSYAVCANVWKELTDEQEEETLPL